MSDQPTQSKKSTGGAVRNQRIYVIVHVTYDHHRFQENYGASQHPALATHIAKEVQRVKERQLPIIRNSAVSWAQDKAEKEHIWIQSFPA